MKENKEEDEAVPTDSLAETVRQILTTLAPVHLPSVDHTTESTVLVEHEADKPSSGVLGDIVEQTKEVDNDLVPTSEQSSVQTTKIEETEQEIR